MNIRCLGLFSFISYRKKLSGICSIIISKEIPVTSRGIIVIIILLTMRIKKYIKQIYLPISVMMMMVYYTQIYIYIIASAILECVLSKL